MMMEAPKLVRRLLALSTSSCHCEWRSMIRPIGLILLRGRLAVAVLSGGSHYCCTGLVPAVSAAATAVSSRPLYMPVAHLETQISRIHILDI